MKMGSVTVGMSVIAEVTKGKPRIGEVLAIGTAEDGMVGFVRVQIPGEIPVHWWIRASELRRNVKLAIFQWSQAIPFALGVAVAGAVAAYLFA